MRQIGILIIIINLMGCTIPTPRPSSIEMVMQDPPQEWTFDEGQIAWLIVNDQDNY